MMNVNFIIKKIMINAIVFMAFFCVDVFAAKYTITNGLDFNTRIKFAINDKYTSATAEKTIVAFKNSTTLPNDNTKIIDISEDGDGTVLAYIKNNTIYYVADDDVYLNQDVSYMFDKFLNIREINLSEFNYDKVKKANFMFGNCRFLTKIDMENDTIIKLNEMKGMFFDCESLTDLNIYMLNTKNVTNMDSLFYNCKNIKNIFIGRDEWSISKVKSFKNMFANCYLLKTNNGRKAIDISENNYKLYATYGDDEGKEGLLKDIDYEYDDYGNKKETYKVANLDSKLIVSTDDVNDTSIDSNLLDIAKKYTNISIATDSSLYEQQPDIFIKKEDKKYNDDLLIDKLETLEDVPILIAETTYVDEIRFKSKEKATSNEIVETSDFEEEIVDKKNIPGGVLRHSYKNEEDILNETDSESKEEKIVESESIVDEAEKEKNVKNLFNINDINLTLLIVLVSIVLIVLFSIIFAYKKAKSENGDLYDGKI